MKEELRKKAQELAQSFQNMPPPHEMGRFYDEIDPQVYDEMNKLVNYTEPGFIVQQIADKLKLPQQSYILDAGCGTGMIGEMLRARGYSNIHGADASEKFIQHCLKNNWYSEADVLWFGVGGDKFPVKYHNTYDCCTASGVFVPNHFPPDAINDIHQSLKTGGYFITAMRSYLWVEGEKHGYKDKVEELISAKKFKQIGEGTFTRGYKGGIEMFAEQSSTYIVLQRTD